MNSILKSFPFAMGYGRALIKSLAIAVFVMPERGMDLLLVWETRLHQRQHLARLNYSQLEDMGMSPEDAARESAKPFWFA
ncbi:hypothetical protein L2D14_02995 [Thalassospiraceae bacterium LMO-JJ14]|nr:hypothetical protein L2D14_02995 [Thalassospiraceae bacterium LMO-JJ14]